MKLVIPEISWHNRDPVLSVHFQPTCNDDFYRLATGGSDSHVFIWRIKLDGSNVNVEFAADLTKHQRAVNTVRFSPNGQWLATGDDESVIVLWKFKLENGPDQRPDLLEDNDAKDLEKWTCHCVLRGHLEDVYDLSWSPDSKKLISGGVDNKAIIWDVDNGRYKAILDDHKGFVQGVAWDPLNIYAATLSSDRTLRIFNTSNNKIMTRCDKAVPIDKNIEKEEIKSRLFHDDTLKSFFRRIAFSPDGQILVTSSGILESVDEENKTKHTTNVSYVFARKSFSKPVLYIPSLDQFSIAVQFSPILYQLKDNTQSVFDLPYRMIYAIATNSSILLMDTQHAAPFAYIGDIHYTRLTDLSWSSDGRLLIVSSSDGFCSILSFSQEELGIPFTESMDIVTMEIDETAQESQEAKNSHKETPTKFEVKEEKDIKQLIDLSEPPTKKRVQLVTLSSPKNKKHFNNYNTNSFSVKQNDNFSPIGYQKSVDDVIYFIAKNAQVFKCDTCDKHYSNKFDLIKHERIHTKVFNCLLCKSRFSNSYGLSRHMRTHRGDKRYCCAVCSKAFHQPGHLTAHVRIHTGEKPYTCAVCNKTFAHYSNLITHRKIHGKDRPYECEICAKKFVRPSNLIEHRRIHGGNKPYSCDMCENRYTRNSHLIEHRRIHTGEKPYKCDVCEEKFAKCSALNKHRKRLHK